MRGRKSADSVADEVSAYVAARWLSLLRSAILLGCDQHQAEDLVQATLVKCFIAWSRVSKADDRDAYVYKVLINTHRAHLRKRSSGEVPARDPSLFETPVDFDTTGLTTSVQRALGALSIESRQVVVLRFFADLTERQTAEALGIPIGTVKSRTTRALDQLSRDHNLIDPDNERSKS